MYGNEQEGIDGARTGAKTRTRVEMRVEGRERLEILEEVIEAGRKTREGGRRLRATTNHSHKARRPSETVASCGGPDPRDGRRGIGLGRVEKRRRSARNLRRVKPVIVEFKLFV